MKFLDSQEEEVKVTPREFVATIFPDISDDTSAAVCTKSGNPEIGDWNAIPATGVVDQLSPNNNNYFNCSRYRTNDFGDVNACKEDFDSFNCVVIDDVGTKVPKERVDGLEPSFIIETSPGNNQYGFILADPITDYAEAARLTNAVNDAGLSDPGSSEPIRWGRLPVGINGNPEYCDEEGKPSICRLIKWNGEIRVTPEEIDTGLQLKIPPSNQQASKYKMVGDSGKDRRSILEEAETQFVDKGKSEIGIFKPNAQPFKKVEINPNPLKKYSLLGKSPEIEKSIIDEISVLNQIALSGQMTVLYAAPNTGKTLIALYLLIEAIDQKRVDPSNVYYLNMDDNRKGLLEKLRIAEEYRFHMLADGYQDFCADRFLKHVHEITMNDQANGVTIILDTLKKVVDLMDKSKSTRFTKINRQFVLKGGTVIALAHTNKNPGKDGKPVYGGVSDIVNDCDCAFMVKTITSQTDSNEKIVEFENFKKRGNVVQRVAYGYSIDDSIQYNELLLSVHPVDETQVTSLVQTATIQSDEPVINTVIECINEGITTKMKLAHTTAQRAGVSRRSAIKIIEKYTGTDPVIHKWQFVMGEHGAKRYTLNAAQPE